MQLVLRTGRWHAPPREDSAAQADRVIQAALVFGGKNGSMYYQIFILHQDTILSSLYRTVEIVCS